MPTAEFHNLTVKYGDFVALEDFSVTLPEGCVGLLGPNGAGKTMFIKTMLGFVEPATGGGTVLGHDLEREGPIIRQNVGYMPEQDCHIPGMNAVQFVAYAGELAGLPANQALRRAHEVLEYCGLGEARYRNVETYSTGMKQRIKLAQALVHGPKLLLLDEPTNGLDPRGREEMLELIRSVSHGKGLSCLVSSHLLKDIERICDHAVVLLAGKLRAEGPIRDLKSVKGHPIDVELREHNEAFVDAVHKRGMMVEELRRGEYRIHGEAALADMANSVFESARISGAQVRHLALAQRSLEEAFLEAVNVYAVGPIADLSYRTYDGALDPPTHRWKVIAKATAMRTVRNKWYWIVSIISGWYYGVMMIVLFFIDQMMQGGGDQVNQAVDMLGGLNWPGQFLHGFSFGQLGFMLIGIMAGAGTIANDNRSNALLVYLSKPCTKKDYLIGKWVGVFVLIAAAMSLPAITFYIFGAMNYREFEFISQDPWIPLRMIAIIALSAAFYTSVVIGVSSLFNQGRLAGATFAGIYLITNFVTVFMGIIIVEARDAPERLRLFAEQAYYFSMDGLCIGVAKIFLDLDFAPLFAVGDSGISVDRPAPWIALGAMFVLGALALRVAWKRVRAVEVVK